MCEMDAWPITLTDEPDWMRQAACAALDPEVFSGTIRGRANEISPALAPGDHAVIVVSTTEKSPKARLAQVNCM